MKRITIIGNSVSLRVRPTEKENRNDNKVYGTLLEERLNRDGDWLVENYGLGRRTVREFEKQNVDFFIRTFPNYFVINLGCVDAPTREIPHWYSKLLVKRGDNIFIRPFGLYYRVVEKYFRPQMVKLRGRKPWVDVREFTWRFESMLEILIKETSAQILVLGVNAGNERVERNLPGTLENYSAYNEIIEQLCDRSFVHFIDVSDLLSETHFPDGVHYDLRGHREIAARLFRKIMILEGDHN